MLRNLFKTEGVDIILLKVGYGLLALLTFIANIVVIKKLVMQKRKTRTTKLFIVLSASDVVVASVTIPMAMLLFYTCIPEDHYCKLVPVIIYFIFAPFKFSWMVTIIIAIDRVLIITRRRIHSKYITNKFICVILAVSFCLANCLSIWNLFTVKYSQKILENNPFNITLSVLEICLISIMMALYIYLLSYVRKKSKIMKRNRVTNQSYASRTTVTTVLVLFTLFICNITYLCGITYVIWSKTDEHIVTRNAIFWPMLALYMNSFLNAVIMLFRGVNSGRSSSISLRSRNSLNSIRLKVLNVK